jgi:hypothetical protein
VPNPKDYNAKVREFFLPLMPKDLSTWKNQAYWDLVNGPLMECETCGEVCTCESPYPGFEKATQALSSWADEYVTGDFYYDTQSGELLDSEPKGFEDEGTGEFVEPMWEDYIKVSRGEVLAVIFGRELAPYCS